MANRLTEEDKILINELYLKYGTYAEVARQTGFAPSTVKKYILKDFVPIEKVEKKLFKLEDIPENPDLSFLLKCSNLGDICVLSNDEKKEIEELWKELVI